jgi:uncharacterized membrane protein YccC
VNAPEGTTGYALRVAIAGFITLMLVEWWHLPHGNQAVWTTNMVLAQFQFTAFQKGLERLFGRGLGILAGVLMLFAFANAPVLVHILKMLTILIFFYINLSGRFAYTFYNAGLYLAVIVGLGRHDPPHAAIQGWLLFIAIAVGVAVSYLVVWVSGSELSVQVQPGGQPLWPLRKKWLSQALMLVVTVEVVQLTTDWLELPESASIISVMVLTIAPDLQALLLKGECRILGALCGGGWALLSFAILSFLPHLALLALLLFLGMFIAAYVARAGGDYAYVGYQMGLVTPLLLVVPPNEFGAIAPAVQRLEGIAVALIWSIVVAVLWGMFTPAYQEVPGSVSS